MSNKLKVEYFVLIRFYFIFLLIVSPHLFYCPMLTELIAQIICVFVQFREVNKCKLKLSKNCSFKEVRGVS